MPKHSIEGFKFSFIPLFFVVVFFSLCQFLGESCPSALWAPFSHWLYFNNTSNGLCSVSTEDEFIKIVHYIVSCLWDLVVL